ncbi:hypothetical protein SAMN06296036_11581 [Pseudobacteriovorax antillogorgiicola]|uniref:Uncharacterized protein n=2 Tax=Pseudobacteriovorax antillogorgiicola TaxID=1513793 RepID=A0A1Y6CDW2_9BACT|nr:hypothetical protein EDD56_110112 [Pseudobacteriovorax antillogorgiicola]SMF49486.1 hypothetical protein SAMN06296036_11581 [Pseudobacteriovorax antillogorgiicola]
MQDQKQTKLSENLTVKVIDAKGLDGCKFLFETSDGRRMQPINLDPTLEQDGLKLEVQVEPTQGMMSICMAGPMVKVLSAKKL